MANFYSELHVAPNVIFNKDPTAVLRLHERPQATDNSMQLLNLHQTNGNGLKRISFPTNQNETQITEVCNVPREKRHT
jgi:hypothetical protein